MSFQASRVSVLVESWLGHHTRVGILYTEAKGGALCSSNEPVSITVPDINAAMSSLVSMHGNKQCANSWAALQQRRSHLFCLQRPERLLGLVLSSDDFIAVARIAWLVLSSCWGEALSHRGSSISHRAWWGWVTQWVPPAERLIEVGCLISHKHPGRQ